MVRTFVQPGEQALALFRESGDRTGEAEALNGVGEILLATGQPDEARAEHAAALALASQIGDAYEQARAHRGLSAALDATGGRSGRSELAERPGTSGRSGPRVDPKTGDPQL